MCMSPGATSRLTLGDQEQIQRARIYVSQTDVCVGNHRFAYTSLNLVAKNIVFAKRNNANCHHVYHVLPQRVLTHHIAWGKTMLHDTPMLYWVHWATDNDLLLAIQNIIVFRPESCFFPSRWLCCDCWMSGFCIRGFIRTTVYRTDDGSGYPDSIRNITWRVVECQLQGVYATHVAGANTTIFLNNTTNLCWLIQWLCLLELKVTQTQCDIESLVFSGDYAVCRLVMFLCVFAGFFKLPN